MEKRNHNCGSPPYLPYHDRQTEAGDQQLHTHVVLPGTAPSVAERLPVYNNASQGHDKLFRNIASRHFEAMLDETIGHDWRRLRETPERDHPDSLADWFPR